MKIKNQYTRATISEFTDSQLVASLSKVYVLISMEWRNCIPGWKPLYPEDSGGSSPRTHDKVYSHKASFLALCHLLAKTGPEEIVFVLGDTLQAYNLVNQRGQSIFDAEAMKSARADLRKLGAGWHKTFDPIINDIFKSKKTVTFVNWDALLWNPKFFEKSELLESSELSEKPEFFENPELWENPDLEANKKRFAELRTTDSTVSEQFEERATSLLQSSQINNSDVPRTREIIDTYLDEEHAALLLRMKQEKAPFGVLYPAKLKILDPTLKIVNPQAHCYEVKLDRYTFAKIVKKSNFFPLNIQTDIDCSSSALEQEVKQFRSQLEKEVNKHRELLIELNPSLKKSALEKKVNKYKNKLLTNAQNRETDSEPKECFNIKQERTDRSVYASRYPLFQKTKNLKSLVQPSTLRTQHPLSLVDPSHSPPSSPHSIVLQHINSALDIADEKLEELTLKEVLELEQRFSLLCLRAKTVLANNCQESENKLCLA